MVNLQSEPDPANRITGNYSRTGRKLTNDRTTLLLCTRQAGQVTESKAPTYLLRVSPDGKRSYLSSLYSTQTPQVYHMEVKGVRYTVQLDTEQATITEVNPMYI